MKILTVVGARPQFIKAAVVSRAIKEFRPDISESIVHTGQHYDSNMSDIFFSELDIPIPNINLGVGGGTHGQNTGRMLEKLEGIMLESMPDGIVVYGDTDSTLAASLAASKLNIPIAHVESGLRSFNRKMPEEINRIITDHLSSILFSPTDVSRVNLLSEGISEDKIKVVGDVMYDASLYYKNISRRPEWFDEFIINKEEFVLCTIHRKENVDDLEKLKNIFAGLSNSPLPVVIPLHPRTRRKISHIKISDKIKLVEPVGYLEMVWLESNCAFIITDSGGVQKEAYFHGKSCVTLREETEWTELVTAGYNVLVGSDSERISFAINRVNTKKIFKGNFYGDGSSGKKIVGFFI